jgi:hypothetical protein
VRAEVREGRDTGLVDHLWGGDPVTGRASLFDLVMLMSGVLQSEVAECSSALP